MAPFYCSCTIKAHGKQNFKTKILSWRQKLNISLIDFIIWEFLFLLVLVISYSHCSEERDLKKIALTVQSMTDLIATRANQKVSRWQVSHAELYYWSRPESRKMQKPPYTNSRDRQPAHPKNQFEVTSFNINHGNWPADCWGENMSPKVSAFQSKVDSFSQWRQLINYLVRIMMDYQKLSLNYYSAAAPC